MPAKRKSKGYRFTIEDSRTLTDLPTWSTCFLFHRPEELEHEIHRLHEQLADPEFDTDPALGTSFVDFILKKLEREAREVLRQNEYPTDLEELSYIEESYLDLQSVSAKKILHHVPHLRYLIRNSRAEEAVIAMFEIMAAAVNMGAHDLLTAGLQRMKGLRAGGQSHKKGLIGVKAIIHYILDKEGTESTAKEIWARIEEMGNAEKRFRLGGDETETYELYVDDDKMVQVMCKVGKRSGTQEKKMTFKTFEGYVTEVKKIRRKKSR